MNRKLLLAFPIIALMLSACGRGGGTSSEEPISTPSTTSEVVTSEEPNTEVSSAEEPSSSKMPTVKDVTILCFIDYNHANKDSDAYYTAKWYYGVPFTKEDIGLVDPSQGNYPEFSTFLGWSLQPIIDSEDQLLEWGVYTKDRDGTGSYVNLYGIWVS